MRCWQRLPAWQDREKETTEMGADGAWGTSIILNGILTECDLHNLI
jgi:hypothetical protein